MIEPHNNKNAGTDKPAVDPFDPESFKTPGIMTAEATAVAGTPDVKLLVFDMGHVFVRFNWAEVCKGFYTRSGHTEAEFKQVLAHVATLGYERGKIGTEEFLRELNAKLGTTLSRSEFEALWNNTFEEDPEMAALLTSLQARYPLYLLSNTNEVHYDHLQGSFDVARHFKELILSYQVGLAKPDTAIYQVVLERSGLRADQCVFVDDLAPNIAAASALGMHAIQFVGIDDLKMRLSALGVAVQ